MKNQDIHQILKENGWTVKRVDSDYIGLYCLDDKIIRLIPSIKKGSVFYFSFSPSISSQGFSKIAAYICNDKKRNPHYHVLSMPEKILETAEIDRDFIEENLKKIIFWAKNQDLSKGINDYVKLPTDSKGIWPLMHLAALAFTKDKEKLLTYLSNFKIGNNMKFVPYITQDYIERAIQMAEK